MEKIPTADSFLGSHNWRLAGKEKLARLLRTFAAIHTKAALEAAAFKANVKHQPFRSRGFDDKNDSDYIVDKNIILNSYPESNIK